MINQLAELSCCGKFKLIKDCIGGVKDVGYRPIASVGTERVVKKAVTVEDTVGNSSLYLEQFLSTSACINMIVRMATGEMVDEGSASRFYLGWLSHRDNHEAHDDEQRFHTKLL